MDVVVGEGVKVCVERNDEIDEISGIGSGMDRNRGEGGGGGDGLKGK